MKITKEYCDRCGKEIVHEDALNYGGISIHVSKPKYTFIEFYDKTKFCEVLNIICDECADEFYEWWGKRVK